MSATSSILRFVVIAGLAIFHAPGFSAVHMLKKKTADIYILQGEIKSGDVRLTKNAVAEAKSLDVKELQVYLDSPGGDAFAAMEIGRLLRSINAQIFVDENATCASACVLIYAAGVFKITTGKIGIHRPYFSTLEDPSYNAVRKRLRKSDEAIKIYLDEMNMPSSLYEAMKMVAPSTIRWLERSELEEYGLWGYDPIYEEILDDSVAKSYGISRQLYYARNQIAESKCTVEAERGNRKGRKGNFLERFSACRDRVLSTGK